MCLDPRPDRLFRAARPARTLTRRAVRTLGGAQAPQPVVRAAALRVLEHLAGEDELVARGWVVVSRQA